MDNPVFTRNELAQKFRWADTFSEEIQSRLFTHYTTFPHGGNANRALMDIQSVSDTLYWAMQNKPLQGFIQEHRNYFGNASADDLIALSKELFRLRLGNEHRE